MFCKGLKGQNLQGHHISHQVQSGPSTHPDVFPACTPPTHIHSSALDVNKFACWSKTCSLLMPESRATAPTVPESYLSLGKWDLQVNFGSYIIKLAPSPLYCCVSASIFTTTINLDLMPPSLWSRCLQLLRHCSPENHWP